MSGDVPSEEDLLAGALHGYGVTLADIQSLLSWPCD
jgi:hypothetical protein